MNKTAIKNFAIWARRKLIADITYKAGLIGVTEKGIAAPLPQSKPDLQFFDIGTKHYSEVSGKEVAQRAALVNAIKDRESTSNYKTAFQGIFEEVAYTWFNRLIAVRFMEVNDYLPSRVRVLSSETPKKNEPDFVTTPFDSDLEFTPYERDRVLQLKDENKLDQLFRMLFIKQCNKLNEILPELFEKTDDYTELLLTISFTDTDDVVYHLTHDISEDDFNVSKEGQVEIIGWLYQYYNAEPKDEVFALLKKNVKITKERIPAATQLFTPDWIVRYMVENSLGRLWLESHPNEKLKASWKYYLEEAEQTAEVAEKLRVLRAQSPVKSPEDIRLIDPCMGSGHILVYAFDVLMQIYESEGYSARDAAKLILEKNLYGIDIDDRACQLSYFALMMKARQYDKKIFSRHIEPNICAVQESNGLHVREYEGERLSLLDLPRSVAEYLIEVFHDAKEYGSLLNVRDDQYDALSGYLEELKQEGASNLLVQGWLNTISERMPALIKQAKTMSMKFDVVVTNPPYMGGKGLSGKMIDFLTDNFPDTKYDTFSAFIERCGAFSRHGGYVGMFTPYVWMFIERYSKLRDQIYSTKDLISLIQFEYSAFEEATVPICTFVYRVSTTKASGEYVSLTKYRGGMDVQRIKTIEAIKNPNCGYRYTAFTEDFKRIPSAPISFAVPQKLYEIYSNTPSVSDYGETREGMATANNDLFLRYWFEVSAHRIGFGFADRESAMNSGKKWFPYNKGGDFRKWYGNDEYLVNWKEDGSDIMNYIDEKTGRIRSHNYNLDYIFHEGITWTALSSGSFGSRYSATGKLADSKGSMLYLYDPQNTKYALGFLNSIISSYLLGTIAQTLDFKPGRIAELPLRIDEDYYTAVLQKVEELVSLSRSDWDTFETSWDFKRHSLLNAEKTISRTYSNWKAEAVKRFITLKAIEEELNRIFIDIYGLQDELTPEVDDKDVTVHYISDSKDSAPESIRQSNYLITRADVIKNFINYAVGCMFGRYSLDVEGLAYAGGDWDGSKYKTFIPDADNCIPITDEEYFEDDIVGRFVAFIRTVYGAETLEENLDFIANALGNKGNTSREVIRNYFLNDFFKNHCQIYQKHPIYWLFDSGKQNGFKALVYMHRWNADTIGNVRVEYLHRTQRVYEKEIARMQDTMDHSRNAREVAATEKRKEKLVKQLKEARDYDAKIAHLALSRIGIDLDDGVKVNYEKVQTGQDGKKIEILAGI